MIGIVDYGLGNVSAFLQAYSRMFIPVCRVTDVATLEQADRVVLPGVGSFDSALNRLRSTGFYGELVERVLEDRVPVLGVCVGFQMMLERSEEGSSSGLGWIPGEVTLLRPGRSAASRPLPHVGWNDVSLNSDSSLMSGLKDSRFYFLHSYGVVPVEVRSAIATTNYGQHFVSVAARDNVYGTQFHPEKSHQWGFRLLRNFAEAGRC